jgi:phytoene synthase
MKEPLEDLVRRVDQDRWLASRFAPAPARKQLAALYAFNYEVARIAEGLSEPGLGMIKLKWWEDAIGALYEGGTPPAHPVIGPLGEAIKQSNLPRERFSALISARAKDLESAPFEGWADLEDYLDATAGGLMALAAGVCMPGEAPSAAREELFRFAGRAWGYTGLVRSLSHWTAQRRTFFPKRLREHVKLDEQALFSGSAPDHAAVSANRAILDRAVGALRDVRRLSPAVPKDMFPALGYVALTQNYIRDLQAGAPSWRASQVARQFKLVGAAATGSL